MVNSKYCCYQAVHVAVPHKT
ncbi:unnamed protein product [Timema podura]|uniref:Uncharacterized protein n=1 Tax=Timema podura TaxID=61482 RepID=A0ABN7PH39_TIMPD|nr:unnamed protein product [Timema podura]